MARGLWIGMARNPRLDFIFEIHGKGMCQGGEKNGGSHIYRGRFYGGGWGRKSGQMGKVEWTPTLECCIALDRGHPSQLREGLLLSLFTSTCFTVYVAPPKKSEMTITSSPFFLGFRHKNIEPWKKVSVYVFFGSLIVALGLSCYGGVLEGE